MADFLFPVGEGYSSNQLVETNFDQLKFQSILEVFYDF